jgi:hypothetical protein
MFSKTCPTCGFVWTDRAAFLADPGLRLIGYQPRFIDLKAGFFLFNHTCGTTFAMQAEAFVDLYQGPIFKTRLTGTDACSGQCLNESHLEPCPAACECAYVRAILDRVAHWPKANPVA